MVLRHIRGGVRWGAGSKISCFTGTLNEWSRRVRGDALTFADRMHVAYVCCTVFVGFKHLRVFTVMFLIAINEVSWHFLESFLFLFISIHKRVWQIVPLLSLLATFVFFDSRLIFVSKKCGEDKETGPWPRRNRHTPQ